ncbi:MAG: ABC transporter ATP-binding protein [Gammaproteobacteria bacterium]|nr:ABC transporter ATP-binding protein [Gammaproteobacteria bacterium]MYI76998.1 ABC transporter ATP-binding protein [Gammaproteobacteria bacterium]
MTDAGVVLARSVSKSFHDGSRTLQILQHVDLEVQSGDQVVILGRSGSGKSTLLHILGGLLRLDEGEVYIAGREMSRASVREQGRIRNESMGFVYQFHHLLPEFTALENVAMPLWIRGGKDAKNAKTKAQTLLELMDLVDRAKHYPHQLSGGEKQRVAVARALVGDPAIVLGDEITGNLDVENAERVLQIIVSVRQELNTAFVLVTHDHAVANQMDRRLWLDRGTLNPYDE